MQNSEDVIIITGATGNLGSATAHAFQVAGQRTVLVDRSQERLRFTQWVEPSAIAQVIQFLASDASRAINGAAIPLFGKG